MLSRPVRALWIEMHLCLCCFADYVSRPVRALWIEISNWSCSPLS